MRAVQVLETAAVEAEEAAAWYEARRAGLGGEVRGASRVRSTSCVKGSIVARFTAATALILARVFGDSPKFWLNVQRRDEL